MGNTEGKGKQVAENTGRLRAPIVERTIVIREIAIQQPTCTYSSSKTQYVTQPFYRCRTCFRGENEGCCAGCVKACHAGHNVFFAGEMNAYCDCGLAVCSSRCKLSDKCTYDKNGSPTVQRWFTCSTCWGEGCTAFGCCEVCARDCHSGHKLREEAITTAVCDCGQNRHKGDVCTFNSTKTQAVPQPFYRCYECFSRPTEGCCYPCLLRCHDGHAIKYVGVTESFCDCGLPGCAVTCKIPKP